MNFSPATDAVFTKKSEDGSLEYWTIVITNRRLGYDPDHSLPWVILRKANSSEEEKVYGNAIQLQKQGFEPVALEFGGIWKNPALPQLPPYTRTILDWMNKQFQEYDHSLRDPYGHYGTV